jgi:hypothetical protein
MPGISITVNWSNLSFDGPGVYEYLAISRNARWMLLKGVTGELPLLDNESVALKSSGET